MPPLWGGASTARPLPASSSRLCPAPRIRSRFFRKSLSRPPVRSRPGARFDCVGPARGRGWVARVEGVMPCDEPFSGVTPGASCWPAGGRVGGLHAQLLLRQICRRRPAPREPSSTDRFAISRRSSAEGPSWPPVRESARRSPPRPAVLVDRDQRRRRWSSASRSAGHDSPGGASIPRAGAWRPPGSRGRSTATQRSSESGPGLAPICSAPL